MTSCRDKRKKKRGALKSVNSSGCSISDWNRYRDRNIQAEAFEKKKSFWKDVLLRSSDSNSSLSLLLKSISPVFVPCARPCSHPGKRSSSSTKTIPANSRTRWIIQLSPLEISQSEICGRKGTCTECVTEKPLVHYKCCILSFQHHRPVSNGATKSQDISALVEWLTKSFYFSRSSWKEFYLLTMFRFLSELMVQDSCVEWFLSRREVRSN